MTLRDSSVSTLQSVTSICVIIGEADNRQMKDSGEMYLPIDIVSSFNRQTSFLSRLDWGDSSTNSKFKWHCFAKNAVN